MEVSVNDYNEVRECVYKGEHFSARDNGAIMRHPREGMPLRPNDNKWTFGKQNPKGYMMFGNEQVHRIVATAYHSLPPMESYIVDHIDTNRANNRPENLRWITKLENTLANDITRKKVITICGSIEAFLENPNLLWNHVNENPNFGWMRTVTKEESIISKERMEKWAKSDTMSIGNGKLSDWIFKKADTSEKPLSSYHFSMNHQNNNYRTNPYQSEMEESRPSKRYPSLTSNVIQVDWKTPTSFVCCPSPTENPSLASYAQNLQKDKLFCTNEYSKSYIHEFELSSDKSKLWIVTRSEGIKKWALARVEVDGGTYVHYSEGSFFTEEGAIKAFTLTQGKEWTGGDTFDDYAD